MSAKAVELMNKTFLKEAEQKSAEDQGIEEAFTMASSVFGEKEAIRYFTQEYDELLNEGEEEEVTIRDWLNNLWERVVHKVGEKVVDNLGENILAGWAGLALLAKQVALDIKAMTPEEIEAKLAEMQPPTPEVPATLVSDTIPSAAVPWAAVVAWAGMDKTENETAPQSSAELIEWKKTIPLHQVELIADPYDSRENSEGKRMTYCSQTAQDNAREIFGLIFPWWDWSAQKTKEATAWGNIEWSRKSNESIDHYVTTIDNVTDNTELTTWGQEAMVADLFVSSSSEHGHRALAFATVNSAGEQDRYVLDPYRNTNKKSTKPIPLNDYTATIQRIDFYTSETVILDTEDQEMIS